MTDDLERELARRFADLARSDEAWAPGFENFVERDRTSARSHSSVRSFALAAAVAAAVSIGASFLWISRAVRQEPAPAVTLADWRSPTSALLDTPGRDLLEGAPDLGLESPEALAPPRPSATPSSSKRPKGASS